MPELTRLRAEDAPAVLAFERANRAWFAASITDRGDDFFERFDERYAGLLAEQAAGVCAFHALLADDGTLLGRFNLVDIEDGAAVVGYRMAERAAGRGLATEAVRQLCRLAADRYGLRVLRAAVAHENVASQRVLAKSGFLADGPAGPADLGGKYGTWYRRDLVPPPPPP